MKRRRARGRTRAYDVRVCIAKPLPLGPTGVQDGA